MRGMGRVYQRGHVWWVQYYFNGRKHRESTRSQSRGDAVRLLRSRLEEVGRGRLIGPALEKTTFGDLAELLLTDYRINRKRSLARIEDGTQHLRRAFSGLTALCLTSDRIMAYIRACSPSRNMRRSADNSRLIVPLAAPAACFGSASRRGR